MPVIPFEQLSDDARLWIFAADRPITGAEADRLLGAADAFLLQWKAHGHPLICGSAWLEDRFLVVAADEWNAHGSGCSIDALFNALKEMQRDIGAQLVGGGRVFYRAPDGSPRCIARTELEGAAKAGQITADTRVFDTALTSMGEWRARFERPARESWIASLVPLS